MMHNTLSTVPLGYHHSLTNDVLAYTPLVPSWEWCTVKKPIELARVKGKGPRIQPSLNSFLIFSWITPSKSLIDFKWSNMKGNLVPWNGKQNRNVNPEHKYSLSTGLGYLSSYPLRDLSLRGLGPFSSLISGTTTLHPLKLIGLPLGTGRHSMVPAAQGIFVMVGASLPATYPLGGKLSEEHLGLNWFPCCSMGGGEVGRCCTMWMLWERSPALGLGHHMQPQLWVDVVPLQGRVHGSPHPELLIILKLQKRLCPEISWSNSILPFSFSIFPSHDHQACPYIFSQTPVEEWE